MHCPLLGNSKTPKFCIFKSHLILQTMSSNFKDRVYIATTANLVMFFGASYLLFIFFYVWAFLQYTDILEMFGPSWAEINKETFAIMPWIIFVVKIILMVSLVLSTLFFLAGYGLKFRYRWGKILYTILGSLLVLLLLSGVGGLTYAYMLIEEPLPAKGLDPQGNYGTFPGGFHRKIVGIFRMQYRLYGIYGLSLAWILCRSLIHINKRRFRLYFN